MSQFRKAEIFVLALVAVLFCRESPAQSVPQNGSFDFDGTRTERGGAPKGWTFAGNAPQHYETWTDIAQGLPPGSRCSIISGPPHSSTGTHIIPADSPNNRFATVMQVISAENYRGKRVRFSAQLSTVEVSGQAALWMRIDGQNGKVLNFDNMGSRPVNGTTPWNQYGIVLDVPMESATIQFGFLLAGSGKAKAAQFHFDVVDAGTPLTAAGTPAASETLSKAPSNLELRLQPL